jgi:soluble epoxide hydrolase/lipid-phosphate phosphatase
MVVWRTANWYPELISHLFAVCTPYQAPSKQYMSTEMLVNGPVPQFGYQLHLASGEVEPKINSKEEIRQFLNGMYGARGPNGETTFSPEKGILFENLPKVGATKLMSKKVSQQLLESVFIAVLVDTIVIS